MTATTITEALAEIKTIGKRVAKKREGIAAYLVRDARLRDPLDKEGGSVNYVARERQAINDLEQRLVAIRTAIQASNLTSTLTVEGLTNTVAEWLTWRREISQGYGAFLTTMANTVRIWRDRATKEGRKAVPAAEAQAETGDVSVAVNERELQEQLEQHQAILGTLDGRLSLHNATTQIEIP